MLFTIVFIFIIESSFYLFYSFSLKIEYYQKNIIFTFSLVIGLIYALILILLMLSLYKNSKKNNYYFYGISQKTSFVTRGISTNYPSNKFLAFTLTHFIVYSLLIVSCHEKFNMLSMLTLINSLVIFVYLAWKKPPHSSYFKFDQIFVFGLMITIHVLFVWLNLKDDGNRNRDEDKTLS